MFPDDFSRIIIEMKKKGMYFSNQVVIWRKGVSFYLIKG